MEFRRGLCHGGEHAQDGGLIACGESFELAEVPPEAAIIGIIEQIGSRAGGAWGGRVGMGDEGFDGDAEEGGQFGTGGGGRDLPVLFVIDHGRESRTGTN